MNLSARDTGRAIILCAVLASMTQSPIRLEAAALPTAPALSNIANVSVGGAHACAVDGAGALYCWGSNATGQLGVAGIPYSSIPVRVTGLGGGIASVSAGGGHTCALTTSATIKCWGSNTDGQLGNGSTIDSSTAVNVAGLSGVTALSAGTDHTCAVANGAARCWGSNVQGQLGDSTAISRTTPITVSGLNTGVTGIAAGQVHTCAALASSGAQCWGSNFYGQLGDLTTNSSSVPVTVNMTGTVTAVAVGQVHSCALISTGGMRCWGYNNYGQIGSGSYASGPLGPTDVAIMGVTSISAGGLQSCAIADGIAFCWGANSNGELGDGSMNGRYTPWPVTGFLSGTLGLAEGTQGGCAIAADRRVKCWGRQMLGNGTELRAAPVSVVGLDGGVSTIRPGKDGSYAVRNGSAFSWGSVPVTVTGITSDIVSISGGLQNTCALLATGAVRCFDNPSVDVPGLSSGVAALSVGGFHACVVMTSGAARCWGSNSSGQLGDGNTTSSSVPVTVTGMETGTLSIAAGMSHTCAVTTGGGVRCWGAGYSGQLGNGLTSSQTTPVDVTGIPSGATAIATGISYSCALVSGGVKCWGNNYYGSLGDGTRTYRYTPVAVNGLPATVTGLITLGSLANHACAIAVGGAPYCWGSNANGQIGDGTLVRRLVATPVLYLNAGVTQIIGGGEHTCALTSAGAVKCWGSRRYGQVGDGSGTDYKASPVYVGDPLPLNPIRTYLPALLRAQ